MSKLQRFLPILCLIIVCVFCVTPTKNAEAKRPIYVGITTPYSPFTFIDTNRHLTGIDVDILRTLSHVIDNKVEFVVLPSIQELFTALKQGRVDIIASGLQSTDARRARYSVSLPYYYPEITLTCNKDAEVYNMAYSKQKKVAYLAQSNLHGFITKLALKYDWNLFRAPDEYALMMSLSNKEIDCVMSTTPIAQLYSKLLLRQIPIQGITIPVNLQYGFVFLGPKNSEIIKALNIAILQAVEDNYLSSIVNKWTKVDQMVDLD